MLKKLVILSASALLITAGIAGASHAWSKYHWDKSTADSTANPLQLGDNLSTAAWDASLAVASTDWNQSVLKNAVVAGASNANCDPTSGRVEVCNGEYGDNGWLGIASIWVKKGKSGHITQGVVKLNDTYFDSPQYDTQAWRDMVTCQEIGHTFGLGHQDENFSNANLGSCMDYTSDPDGTILGQLDNRYPNQHDYDEMTEIYSHLNSTDGGSPGPGNGNGKGGGKGKPKKVGSPNIDLNNPSAWGEAIKQDAQGKNSVYRRELGNGQTLITHVLWAE
jgi:hypothetical protein